MEKYEKTENKKAPVGYQLAAYDPDFEQKMSKAEDIMRHYRNTLRALA